jgi:hypothetical protein
MKWIGEVPEKCEACGQPFTGNVFFDAAVGVRRIWGLVCLTCHTLSGHGLGTGKGQKYDLTTREKLDG